MTRAKRFVEEFERARRTDRRFRTDRRRRSASPRDWPAEQKTPPGFAATPMQIGNRQKPHRAPDYASGAAVGKRGPLLRSETPPVFLRDERYAGCAGVDDARRRARRGGGRAVAATCSTTPNVERAARFVFARNRDRIHRRARAAARRFGVVVRRAAGGLGFCRRCARQAGRPGRRCAGAAVVQPVAYRPVWLGSPRLPRPT